MNKTYKYGIITLLLAVIFALGSIEVMNYVLQVREKELLTERGKVIVESPVQAWNDGEEIADDSTNQERHILSGEQMADIILSWNNREMVLAHEPVEGQISMEDAVKAGEKWLAEMNIEEKEEQEIQTESYSINATLGVGKRKNESGKQVEPYYSFWTIQFVNKCMNTDVYVNAVTGQVWGAEVRLYDEIPEKFPYEKLRPFVEMATSLNENTYSVIIDEEKSQAFLEIQDSLLYGQMECYFIPFSEKGYYDIQKNKTDNKEIFRQGYMEIVYKIVSNDK